MSPLVTVCFPKKHTHLPIFDRSINSIKYSYTASAKLWYSNYTLIYFSGTCLNEMSRAQLTSNSAHKIVDDISVPCGLDRSWTHADQTQILHGPFTDI